MILPTSNSVYGGRLIPSLPLDQEILHLEGRGCLAIEVFGGDEVVLVNCEGGQVCEVISVGDGVLRESLSTRGELTLSMLRDGSHPDHVRFTRVYRYFADRGYDWEKVGGLLLFGEETEAGFSERLHVEGDGYLLIATPSEGMEVWSQDTSTPIRIEVKRSKPRDSGVANILPSPLAEPLQDIRVHAATAEAYVVKKGEYIQVYDVDGRQCTDFQCFDRRKLDKGLVKPLDVTATRSISGRDYPLPSLFAKSYDDDMTALVEVVQDTCGRHDAFGLACFAKYYDDMGYVGHVNCTDNFNRVLEPYGIGARKGWMAQNYFYNTGVDDGGVMYFDEPWSRPGDYVLLRALTDLVCVSSACPDDTSPANGWQPSDIHVRTYASTERFSRSVAYRVTPQSEPKMTVETAFHPYFSRMTRDYVEYRGFWLPNCFSENGPIEEYWACRENAVLLDLSALRKCEVTGPDAERLMQMVTTRNMKKLSTGQVVYSAMCYEHGGMVDDCTVMRLDVNNFRWVGGDDYSIEWMREVAKREGLRVSVRSSTHEIHNVALQGPNSREILKDVIWTCPQRSTILELGCFRFTVGRIGDDEGVPVVVSRTGYTGELGYEVWCHPKDAGSVFEALWKAGEPYGMKPLGFEALDMLRIEAGLIFYGHEFCEERDPFEAGIGFTVPLKSKEDDFIGKDALLRLKEHPRKRLVGLEVEGNELIAHGDCVHVGRPQIGTVTSAVRSPILKKNIALAQVDVAHTELGTEVEIGKLDGHQKRVKATIVPFPHYDPTKSRVRA
jgi:aminomethyltransferase